MNIIKRIRHKLGRHPLLKPIPNDTKAKRAERHAAIRQQQQGG